VVIYIDDRLAIQSTSLAILDRSTVSFAAAIEAIPLFIADEVGKFIACHPNF